MIKLTRTDQSEQGTFGVLSMDGIPLAVTCEDPWNDNQTGISCIPDGEYLCVPHNGVHFQNVWELEGVPGRSAILIHSGNTIKDTRGCILVGKSFDGPAVLSSRVTLDFLRKVLPKSFTLTIKGV